MRTIGSLGADKFVTWKLEFIDKWSNGKIITNESRVDANVTEEELIKHYGLNEDDVIWYKLTKIED